MSWLTKITDAHHEVESPEIFFYWSAMAAMSAVVKKNVYLNRFIYNFLKMTEASYKWYVSGTPFTTLNGVEMVMQFLDVQLEYNNILSLYRYNLHV